MSTTEQQLAKRVKDAKAAYYNGSPIMSDAAYDALEAGLRAVAPDHAALKGVGAACPSCGSWPKAPHAIPMGSLNKAQFDADAAKAAGNDGHADLRGWFPTPVQLLTISHKLDGISIDLVYRDRKLVQAITRGDGAEGEDITRNVLLMEGAVKVLPPTEPDDCNVRGEIVVRKSKFAAHFPGESNPRNTASGTSKRQTDAAKCQYLTVVAYQYLPSGIPLESKETELVALENMGFVTTPHYSATTVAEVLAIYNDYIMGKRAALDWDIDGLVLDVDDRDRREGLGVSNMRPKGTLALKFPHASAPSVLRDVIWQVGKSGRITPVAVFDTVNLAGANISRASLHNPDYIDDIASAGGQQVLSVGDEIEIERRNDVIPGIAALIATNPDPTARDIVIPPHCPNCGTSTVRDGAYLICPNTDTCSAQISGAIKRWIAKIGVKHFGTSLVDLLCENGTIERIADLYVLDPDVIAKMEDKNSRKVGGTATKAIRNLHANDKTTLPLHVFVGSLGIPMIGRSMAQKIVEGGFESLNAMTHAREADIARIPGVGPTKAKAFLDGFWDLLDRGTITSLLVHITIAEKATGPFSSKSVCMSGFRDAQMAVTIESQGGTVKSGVSKGLTILVAKTKTGTSGKLEKARQYGVEIIDVEEMWDRLGGRP